MALRNLQNGGAGEEPPAGPAAAHAAPEGLQRAPDGEPPTAEDLAPVWANPDAEPPRELLEDIDRLWERGNW